MAIIDVRDVSMHCFRASRRRAAIEKKDAELKELKVALQKLWNEPIVKEVSVVKEVIVEKEVFVVVEKIVEVPIEKPVEVNEAAYTEADVTKADVERAFNMGVEMSAKAKEEEGII